MVARSPRRSSQPARKDSLLILCAWCDRRRPMTTLLQGSGHPTHHESKKPLDRCGTCRIFSLRSRSKTPINAAGHVFQMLGSCVPHFLDIKQTGLKKTERGSVFGRPELSIPTKLSGIVCFLDLRGVMGESAGQNLESIVQRRLLIGRF